MEALLTQEQVAAKLGLKPNTLAVWRTHKKGPKYIRVGRNIRYSQADLDAWLKAGGQGNA